MDKPRWIYLLFLVIYIGLVIFAPIPKRVHSGENTDTRIFKQDNVSGFFMFLGFVCIWWPDILGGALVMGRGAWNPIPSTEGAVKLLGWIFVISAIAVRIILLN